MLGTIANKGRDVTHRQADEVIAQIFNQCGLPHSTMDEAISPTLEKKKKVPKVMQSANDFVITMNEAVDLSLDAIGLITEVIMSAGYKGDAQ